MDSNSNGHYTYKTSVCVWCLRSEMMGDCYRETSYLDDGCNDFDGRWSIVAMDIWTLLIIYNESNTATMIDNEKVWWSLWISWQFVIWGHQKMPSSEKRMNLRLAYHLSWFCYHYCCLWKMEVIPTLILINQQSEKDMIWIFHWGTLQDRNAHGAYFQVWSAFMFFFSVKSSQHLGLSENRLPPNFMEFMSHIFPIYFPLKWPLDGAFPMAFPWRPRTPRCWGGQGEGRPRALHLHDLDQRDVVIPDLRLG